MRKRRIALLYGGISSEREVSLAGGNQVFEALDKDKYRVTRYDPLTDLSRLVSDASQIDAALVILHGPYGEDGTVQGLLELLGIPYQGAGVLGSALAMNKRIAKKLYAEAGLMVPPHVPLKRETRVDAAGLVEELGLPLVVKPAEAGSSVGMTVVRRQDEVVQAVDKALHFSDWVLAERYIKGTELTVGVLGDDPPEPLPVIQIVPGRKHEFFDYEAKYTPGATEEICPAPIDDRLKETIQYCAVVAHEALCCQGYSRSDFIATDSALYILETNTIPGMTPTSLFPQAAQAAGYSFSELLDRLIEMGMKAHKNNKGKRQRGF